MNTKKVRKYYISLLAITSMIIGNMVFFLSRCNFGNEGFVHTIIQIAILCFLIIAYIVVKKQFSKEEWDDRTMVVVVIVVPFIIGFLIFSFLMVGA